MKVRYIVALLMIVLMVGCATKQQEAAPAEAAAPETPPAAPAEAAAPETPPAAPEAAAPADLSDADKARIDSLKASCERGVVKMCLVLKNTYSIDWPPKATEEPEVSEEGGSAGEATE